MDLGNLKDTKKIKNTWSSQKRSELADIFEDNFFPWKILALAKLKVVKIHTA